MLGRDRDISLHGPDAAALFRTVLLQASSVPRLMIICAGTPEDLDPESRFLTGVSLAALPVPSGTAAQAASALLGPLLPVSAASGEPAWIVLLAVRGAWAGYSAALLQALPEGHRAHATVVRVEGPPGTVHVSLAAGKGVVTRGGDTLEFLPDLLTARTFSRLSRALGARAVPAVDAGSPAAEALPRSAAFESFISSAPETILHRWRAGQGGAGSPGAAAAVVGISGAGPLTLDLDRDGPHFLVAGTTGAGKSEFLRAFLAGLAAALPPDALSMLFIDFKGGAGLGPLAELPHSVGLLTDFSAENVSRALVSLRAEVRRREALLAEAGADNLRTYNALRTPGLPRLLVVVDEFRMLADEVPAALPELLRLAAVGRSLGLHLVLATQRPQGSITTDIRANIATSVALRVQTGAESRDVINSDCAARIPPDLPGRAYVSRGGTPALLFQSLSTGLRPGHTQSSLRELREQLEADLRGSSSGSSPAADLDALPRVCSAIRDAAAAGGYRSPFTPVLPPLPHVLTRSDLAFFTATAPGGGGLALGLLDDPDRQSQRLLSWHPELDSHLAVLGAPRAGDCIGLAALEHQRALPGRHLYVLDADGSLAGLAGCAQTGAYAGAAETERGARILAYLASELARRGCSPGLPAPPSGSGMYGSGETAGITLFVTGWSRWSAGFRGARGLSGEEDLADLIRDGERADIAVVIAGDREVLHSRFYAQIPNRMFFPLEASAETLLLWPRLPPMDRLRGRALVQGRIGTPEGLAAQLMDADSPLAAGVLLPEGCPPPRRVEALPQLVGPDSLVPSTSPEEVPVGVSGDELTTASVRVPSGSVFLVVGPRGSGRSSFLQQMKRAAHPSLDCRLASDAAVVLRSVEPGKGRLEHLLVLVDDADRLPPGEQQKLAELQGRGARIVLAVLPGHQLTSRVPLALHVRSAPRGALLQPSGPSDGDILGIRPDPGVRHPAGRCYLVDGSDIRTAQAAFRTED